MSDALIGAVDRRFVVPIAVMLGGSLLAAIRIPGLDIGLSNALILAAGVALVATYRADLRQLGRRFAVVVLAGAGVWAWTLVTVVASPLPGVALRSWLKGGLYGVGAMGWFAVLASPKRVPAVARLVLGFLVALGLFGVLESAFPESIPFAILRSDDSLSITPRVASLMPWPNQYGVAMIVGLALVEILVGCRGLAGRPAWPVRVLLLSQIAQSGSRNAWLVLTATVALLVVRRITPWRRAVILAALFAGIVLTLPVPARQLGLRHGSWLPPANQMIDEPLGWSPSLSPVGLSVDLRSQLWSEAVTAIERHPITGLGPNVFQATAGLRVMNETGFNTHDLLLELWVGIGTVGLILIGLAVVLAWRVRPPGAVVTGVPLAVMLLGQVFDCYTHDPTMVVLMALATAAVWSGTGDP